MKPTTTDQAARTASEKGTRQLQLMCPSCGNDRRFIQVMAEQANLVNGYGDHIRLLEGIVDRYTCWDCGVTIEAIPPIPA